MWKIIAMNILGIILIVGGIYLATQGVRGWGWLVFLGVISGASFEYSVKEKNKDK